MHIKKSILAGIAEVTGAALLVILGALFCLAESKLPAAALAACWFGCLYATAAVISRICR